VANKIVTPNLVVEIGAGAKSKYGLEANFDKMVGKDINNITDLQLKEKTIISKQSIYHVQPQVMYRLVTHPMLFTASYFSEPEVSLSEGTLVRQMNGRVGKRMVFEEFNYDPAFFRQQGFDVYADFMHINKPAPFYASNMLASPSFIKEKVPVLLKIKPIGQEHRPKFPKNIQLLDIKRKDLFSTMSFYQTHKIDGIPGIITNDRNKLRFTDRTGTLYSIKGLVCYARKHINIFVEMLPVVEKDNFKDPSIKCYFYFNSLDDGNLFWEDVDFVDKNFPQIGFKSYKKIPYKSVVNLEEVTYPTDGVVYVPVLSYYKRFNNKINPLSTHYFFKPCPTVDVTYAEIKSQRRNEKLKVVFWDENVEKEYSSSFAQYNESNLSLPFLYEMSSYYSNGQIKRVITHVRMDKRKSDAVLEDHILSDRNQKGIFFFTRYAQNYEEAVIRFFLSLSPKRKALPFNLLGAQTQFYDNILNHLKEKFLDANDLIDIDAHILYDYLKTITSAQMALYFVDLTMKNASVGKKYEFKNYKVYQKFIFDFSEISVKSLFKSKAKAQKNLLVQQQVL